MVIPTLPEIAELCQIFILLLREFGILLLRSWPRWRRFPSFRGAPPFEWRWPHYPATRFNRAISQVAAVDTALWAVKNRRRDGPATGLHTGPIRSVANRRLQYF